MAFVRLICKAKAIEKRKMDLIDEKKISIEEAKGNKMKYNLKQRYHRCCAGIRQRIIGCFSFPKNSYIHKTCYNLRHEGTCENFVLKSVVGFIGGFCLTYIFFMFFVFQLNFKLSTATIMCAIFGSILTIGLAFSFKVRCVVFLLLPQFFSKRGRQALLAYAFILAITGPAKNTLHNMGILSESLACGQEQLKQAVKQILEVIKKPFLAIKEAIKAVVKTIKLVVKKIKEILIAIKRIILSIIKVIKAAFQFLAKILSICNKELGTPFERCGRVFEDAISDCHAKLGPLFDWLCSVAYLTKHICYIVKMFDYVCMIVDFISNSIIGVVIRKIKSFVRHIRTMFYVRIKFSHSFHFQTNQSKSMNEIATGIVTEIKERSEGLMKIFDFMSCATSLFFMFIIFRVVHYRYKFLTNERFDNKFITKDFRLVDLKRAQQGKETVLPLNHRERNVYITVGSMRLVKKEKVKLSQSAVVLLTATLKLATHMIADYSLWWVLNLIRTHGRFQSKVPDPKIPKLNIEGKGLLADLLRSIVKAFQPVGIQLEIDTVPCLPDPIPPDYDRYVQIVTSLILCWFLTTFEPYGLRMRHSVMCYYHPLRARERSIWLYNHIMRSRSSFLKFARRQLKRKFTGSNAIAKITFKEYLRDNLQCWWLRCCLGPDKQDCCLLCGDVFRESDKVKPIRCQTPGCPGMYCEQCYNDLQNLCTVCLDPIQYGDLSDISEEKDSSSEDDDARRKRRRLLRKKTKSASVSKHDLPSDTDDEDEDNFKPDLNTLLIPYPDKDSDYYSTDDEGEDTGASTDYSYSYQENKDITSVSTLPKRTPFVDVEKQYIPDYASMESFHEEYVPETSQFESSSYITDYTPHHTDEQTERIILSDNYDTETDIESLIEDINFQSETSNNTTPKEIINKHNNLDNYNRERNQRESSSRLNDVTRPQNESPSVDECISNVDDQTPSNAINLIEGLGYDSGSSYITELEEIIEYLSPRSSVQERNKKHILEPGVTSITLTADTDSSQTTRTVPQLDLAFLETYLDEEEIYEEESKREPCTCVNPLCTRDPCTCKKVNPFDESVKLDVIDETSRPSSSTFLDLSPTIVGLLNVDRSFDRHRSFTDRGRYINQVEIDDEANSTDSESETYISNFYDTHSAISTPLIAARESVATTNFAEASNTQFARSRFEAKVSLSVIEEVTQSLSITQSISYAEPLPLDSSSDITIKGFSKSVSDQELPITPSTLKQRNISETTDSKKSTSRSYKLNAADYYRELKRKDMNAYMKSIEKSKKSFFGFLVEGFKR